MADNTLQNGTDTIATDELTTINGVAAPVGLKVQRNKMGFGADGDFNDVSSAVPMPARITNGSVNAGMEPFGALSVNNGFTTLFYDSWSTSPIDTANKWTVTGTAPTIADGNMQMAITPSTYNAIRTKDTVRPNAGFTLVRNGIQLEMAAATGCGRFVGLGTPATTPSAISLVQDGIGTEVDQATGDVLAVTYAAGVRTTIATLTRPTDGATHPIGLYFRVTQAYWTMDGVVVASRAFPDVRVVELPALIVRQNAAAFVGVPAFVNIAHLTADTSRQGWSIADPVIGTRMVRVGPDGAIRVNEDGNRAITFTGAVGSFRTLGTAALLQNVFSIENAAGSGVLVRVTGLDVKLDATAVLVAVVPLIKLSRPGALPTGGTALAKANRDTALTSNASVVIRGATASDGGAATAITATQGAMFKAAGGHRMHTAVGQVIIDASSLLPFGEPITLRAGEALLVTVDAAATTSNPATNHWQVGVAWEEYTTVA